MIGGGNADSDDGDISSQVFGYAAAGHSIYVYENALIEEGYYACYVQDNVRNGDGDR